MSEDYKYTIHRISADAMQMRDLGDDNSPMREWLKTHSDETSGLLGETVFATKDGEEQTAAFLIGDWDHNQVVLPGDWVVRFSDGRFRKCSAEEFEACFGAGVAR